LSAVAVDPVFVPDTVAESLSVSGESAGAFIVVLSAVESAVDVFSFLLQATIAANANNVRIEFFIIIKFDLVYKIE
ncbi:hypothetical protein SB725_30080, partial [Pseudomonas sp. SIMBA_041]|uniref:hypothetical protein n=1 Tax=Pseudomonas sp. SIMBA_041 TaxID=3085782 RepID=UPI00397AFF73